MRVPEALIPLLDQGVVQDVLRPLMSGKEADVFLVVAEDELRVAKIYKEAANRSFKHRAEYTEGRKVRNSRQQRAMTKRSRYGREQIEAAWRNAEVDVIYRLTAAGVRVPEPFAFVEGVLVMELVQDAYGEPAPRLVDATFSEDEAWDLFHILLREVVKMLCAGIVHGDLSDFNVLLSADGPVIIDFPQAVDAAHNRNARKLLIRDVDNLTRFLARHTPALRSKNYGEEMWVLYESGELTPDTRLTGRRPKTGGPTDTSSLLREIEAMQEESRRKREALGLPPRRPARTPKTQGSPDGPRPHGAGAPAGARSSERSAGPPAEEGSGKKRRRRKKRGGGGGAPEAEPAQASGDAFDTSDDLDAFLLVED
ncbi:MAG: PA4780 family RIO1-like protein kinase [Myxococcota bacterium]